MAEISSKRSGGLSAQFHGVAVYNDGADTAAVAGYKTVVAGMTRDRLDNFFFPGLMDVIENPPGGDEKKAMSLLQGDHPSDFRVTMVAATNNGARVYLPMIDDKLLGRTLIVGPGAATPGRIADNVTYVDATKEGARDAINAFMADGARIRAEREKLALSDVVPLIEDIIRATSGAADITGDSNILKAGTTIADVMLPIALGRSAVTLYAVAAQTPRKFKL
ncbi:MAG TPA: hypothetical protein VEF76_02775 [Patescibacteria group bacterium]|nr:hypothetical protein [Patescibacteria group bacterium]